MVFFLILFLMQQLVAQYGELAWKLGNVVQMISLLLSYCVITGSYLKLFIHLQKCG